MTVSYQDLTAIFKALAHPVRLQIVDILRRGEVCVCHVETALGQRQPNISQQLRVLREAGLVATRREGARIFYRLRDNTVAAILEAALGPVMDAPQERLAGCPCPRCAARRAELIIGESTGG